ncbi:MAG: hypothetical protein V4520_12045 [Bacteroidota bacterium]
MELLQLLMNSSGQPITHQLLLSWLKDYKRPNDKIKALKSDGMITSLKKGLYIAGPKVSASRPESGLLANHIYGPSYLSMETALSYYGLIPERVYGVASMTTKASREFTTPAGVFTYTHLPLPYYAFGLRTVKLGEQQFAMIASPEKALCDKIISTSGLLIRSTVQAAVYLNEDLRMEESALKELDTEMMTSWLEAAPKRESLTMVIKMMKNL